MGNLLWRNPCQHLTCNSTSKETRLLNLTDYLRLQAILVHPGFKKLTVLASTQLKTCKAQQLANILWAFATLEFIPIPQFLENLAEEAISKRKGFNPQNVANMLWAFAKVATPLSLRLIGLHFVFIVQIFLVGDLPLPTLEDVDLGVFMEASHPRRTSQFISFSNCRCVCIRLCFQVSKHTVLSFSQRSLT